MDQEVPENKAKKLKTDNEVEEVKMSGGSNEAGPGYRGAFIGETMENTAFNDRHKEQLHITTRNLITRDIAWVSRGFVNSIEQYVSQTAQKSNYYEDDSLRSEVINMYAPLFADQKLLGLLENNTKPGYSKAKLNAIRFTLTFSNYRGSWIEDGFDTALYDEETNLKLRPIEWSGNTRIQYTQSALQQPLSHYVYRDRYDEYSPGQPAQANILPIPLAGPPTGTTSNVKEYRSKKFLENEVNGLTLVRAGETFHFERKVSAKGAYYITAGQVHTLFKTPTVFSGDVYNPDTTVNIQTIINELEGITETLGLVQQLGEGYNLLVVPASMTYQPFKLSGEDKVTVQPAIKTQIHIKCEADWFLYDFSYGNQVPLREINYSTTNEETLQCIQDYFKVLAEKKTKAKRLNRKHKQSDTVFSNQFKDKDNMKC